MIADAVVNVIIFFTKFVAPKTNKYVNLLARITKNSNQLRTNRHLLHLNSHQQILSTILLDTAAGKYTPLA